MVIPPVSLTFSFSCCLHFSDRLVVPTYIVLNVLFLVSKGAEILQRPSCFKGGGGGQGKKLAREESREGSLSHALVYKISTPWTVRKKCKGGRNLYRSKLSQ